MNVAKQKIIVVGVGIVGASIAYHLARAGAAVTVLEQNCPASGVTGKSFAWINLSQGVNRRECAAACAGAGRLSTAARRARRCAQDRLVRGADLVK